MPPEVRRGEAWQLRGVLDAQCGACGGKGVEVLTWIAVEATTDGTVIDLRLVDQSPVEMRCLACGGSIKYDPLVKVVA